MDRMRICLNLYPVAPGKWGGGETYCRWITDIPQHAESTHEFEVLLHPSQLKKCARIIRGRPLDPFARSLAETDSGRQSQDGGTGATSNDFILSWERIGRLFGLRPLSSQKGRRSWLERRKYDLVHCPYPGIDPFPPNHARIPYAISLHDLQHEHFPQFFENKDLATRRANNKMSASIASVIFVVAEHVKADIVHYLGTKPEKIRVVWPGPPFEGRPPVTDEQRAEVRARLSLPDRFFFYPAVTWEHKNHLRLLQALALTRERHGYRIPFVFSGASGPHHQAVLAEVARLGLEGQVKWLGYVAYEDLRRIYTIADATVVPTLYEASSAPVYEAMAMGCPVACSNVANLPWLVDKGRAGLLFDPMDIDAMTGAVERLWEESELRLRLTTSANQQLKAFSWVSFAREYLNGYEQAAGGRV
jgi:glycosyltransferase involved in cell wall biosynthesis